MNGEVSWLIDIGRIIRTDAGIAAFVLFLGCMVFLALYLRESKDRRQAWKAHNDMAKETNVAISQFAIAVTLLKESLVNHRKGN